MTTTDGSYSITGIEPGTWKVREVLTGDWICTTPSGGFFTETFISGDELSDNNFGNYERAEKSGYKFHDLDADGVWDEGEPGLSGWTIFVDYDNDGSPDGGEPYDVTTTDGSYSITGIEPGTWKVREEMQLGWTQSLPGEPYYYYEETFESGDVITGNDFGNYIPTHYETAWGYYDGCISKDFLDENFFDNPEFSNWGWSNGPFDVTTDGGITLTLLAGAGSTPDGESDWENGIEVGTVEITWTSSGVVTATYEIYEAYTLDAVHLWVGNTLLPTTRKGNFTNAPGQFPYGGTIDGNTCEIEFDGDTFTGNIYISAHAVVGIPGME